VSGDAAPPHSSRAALAYYESLGIKVERVMTDNGSCYKSFFRRRCKRLRLKHIRTKPYLRVWAYAKAYQHSRQRTDDLPFWLHSYNWHRPHAGIGDTTPISKLGLTGNNVLRLHRPEVS
jgi:transposase InsO family protein